MFGQADESRGELKWVSSMAVSPDGKYFALGEESQDKNIVTLYEVATDKVVWEKAVGKKDARAVKIALDAKYVLFLVYKETGVLTLTQ
jgi:WD40 repeat protein